MRSHADAEFGEKEGKRTEVMADRGKPSEGKAVRSLWSKGKTVSIGLVMNVDCISQRSAISNTKRHLVQFLTQFNLSVWKNTLHLCLCGIKALIYNV